MSLHLRLLFFPLAKQIGAYFNTNRKRIADINVRSLNEITIIKVCDRVETMVSGRQPPPGFGRSMNYRIKRRKSLIDPLYLEFPSIFRPIMSDRDKTIQLLVPLTFILCGRNKRIVRKIFYPSLDSARFLRLYLSPVSLPQNSIELY